MRKLTKEVREDLEREVEHIMESGANTERLVTMFENFLDKRMPNKEEFEESSKAYAENECSCYTNDYYGHINGMSSVCSVFLKQVEEK